MSTSPSTNCKITILTGAVHCGKSRALGRFMSEMKANGKEIGGLLNPSIDNEKWFVDLATDDIFSAERLQENDALFEIGKYKFSEAAYRQANEILQKPLNLPCDFYSIDELGKLEFNGKGLEPALSGFLEDLSQKQVKNLIIVIRDFMVEDAIERYGFKNPTVLTQTELFTAQWD